MKHLQLVVLLFMVTSGICFGTERGFHYQAVVRDSTGNLMPNAGVNFRFTIKNTTFYGATVVRYMETHVATTNNLGIVNLVIGNGTPVPPYQIWDFENNISWEDPQLTLMVEVDPTGSGSAYSLLSNSPIRATPFSYFSQNAQHSTNSDIALEANQANYAYYANSLFSPCYEEISFVNPLNSFSGNGSGLTNLSAGNISNGLLSPQNGGTGLNATSVAPGTMLYASSSGTWNVIPPGSNGQVLKMNGGVPTWSNESTSGRLVFKNSFAGIPTNPSSTTAFITQPCTLTVTSNQQTLLVVSSISLYGYSTSSTYPYVDGAVLSLLVKPSGQGSGWTLSSVSATFFNYDKRQFNLHGTMSGLAPGTYYVGITATRSATAVGTITGDTFDQQTFLFD